MATFDYCQFVLLKHSCEDYQKDNCDFCNVYRAYREGVRFCAYEIEAQIKAIESCNEDIGSVKDKEKEHD